MAETFILYIYVCASTVCNWTYGGEFNNSYHLVQKDNGSNKLIKTSKYNASKMCQNAASQLSLRDGTWKCISSGTKQ